MKIAEEKYLLMNTRISFNGHARLATPQRWFSLSRVSRHRNSGFCVSGTLFLRTCRAVVIGMKGNKSLRITSCCYVYQMLRRRSQDTNSTFYEISRLREQDVRSSGNPWGIDCRSNSVRTMQLRDLKIGWTSLKYASLTTRRQTTHNPVSVLTQAL